jgi:enoyl-CoA hydratase/carnithine racemase
MSGPTSEEVLVLERDGAVAVITLNRPSAKNAIDSELRRALRGALEGAGRDAAVRAVVLTGAGGAFCAGADLKTSMRESPAGGSGFGDLEPVLEEYHSIIRAIVEAPKPVIAMVEGPAVGFGCDLALACDLRLVAPSAYFQEKFVRLGLMPDGGGTFWLPRLVGLARAMEMILTGEAVPAERALSFGIANRVVDAPALRAETLELAHQLALGPPLAFAHIKRAVHAGLGGTIEQSLAMEKQGQLRCLASRDCLEGVMAWIERRAPTFHGE